MLEARSPCAWLQSARMAAPPTTSTESESSGLPYCMEASDRSAASSCLPGASPPAAELDVYKRQRMALPLENGDSFVDDPVGDQNLHGILLARTDAENEARSMKKGCGAALYPRPPRLSRCRRRSGANSRVNVSPSGGCGGFFRTPYRLPVKTRGRPARSSTMRTSR